LSPFGHQAHAQSDEPSSIVVFKLEGEAGDGELRGELTRAMREEVQQQEDYELVNDDPVVLSDVVVVLGCDSPTTTCLEKAADHFGADYLIFGDLEAVRDRNRVSVRLFDPARGRYARSFGRVLAEAEPPYESFRREVQQLLDPSQAGAAARKEESSADEQSRESADETSIQVTANVEGARVEVDGEVVGRTPVERLTVEPGEYRVRVTREGYTSWSTIVELDEGAAVQIRAPLQKDGSGQSARAEATSEESEEEAVSQTEERQGSESVETPETDPPPSARTSAVADWGPWVAVGLGGVALIGSGIEAARLQSTQKELAAWRERNPPSLRESCGAAQTRECELIDRGERAELSHRVLLGVGVASATVGGLWLLFRNGADESGRASRNWGVTFSGRGIGATWQW
jgi:hypothetical protein